MRRVGTLINQWREPAEAVPLASMAPVTPRLGERPTVASVVRRHLQRARAAAAARRAAGESGAALLPCGHPADQPHDRFHPFHQIRSTGFGRGTLARM